MTSDDYYTPAWVFERMGLEFDLDVASPPGGIDWIPAKRYYTQADDGLAQPWQGRVWMNPPWSNPTPWVERFIDHRNGVCYLPTAKSRWFHEVWDKADAVIASPDSKFHRNGQIKTTAFASVLAAFGPECVEAISRLGTVRVIA